MRESPWVLSMLSLGMCSSPAPSLSIPCSSTISSPGSPKSWEESLVELSRGLQVICGSPEERPTGKGLGLLSPTKLSPPSPPTTTTTSVGGLPTIHEYKRSCSMLSPTWRTNAGIPWTPNSSPEAEYRPLLVRHEESENKLQEKLARICLKKNEQEQHDEGSGTTSTRSQRYVLRRESLKIGFRFHQDVSTVDIDKLLISVDNSGLLSVGCIADWVESAVISEMQLPPETDIQKIVSTVSVCNVLYLRERTSAGFSYHSTGLEKIFLPIIIEDEVNARVKCILHIPDNFRADDVHVKTLDDHLVVSCSDKSSVAFKMDIQLPDGVETRTISAKISTRNQLLVTGVLGSSNRRYTF